MNRDLAKGIWDGRMNARSQERSRGFSFGVARSNEFERIGQFRRKSEEAKTMTKEKPTHLDVVASIDIGEDKTKWTRIGVAFPLRKRLGYSVRLEFLPVPKDRAYEFILVEPGEQRDGTDEE